MGVLSGIALGALFVETLADHLSLPEALVVLSTQRECVALQNALKQRGKHLPRFMALSDLELGDADSMLSPLHQQVLLSRLIMKSYMREVSLTVPTAMGFARGLMRVLEEVDREEVHLDHRRATEDLSQYGQYANDFLQIVTTHWPHILKELGKVTREQQKKLTFNRWIQRLQEYPPAVPVILVGFFGTSPSVCRLIKTVLGMEKGEVILPAFDSEDLQRPLPATHPLYATQDLLSKLNVQASDVKVLGNHDHSDFVRTLMQPAGSVPQWAITTNLPVITPLICQNENLEARTIAVLAREAHHAGRKLCIISPDPNLARRVRGELMRWDLSPEMSYEIPLAQTPQGAFCLLTASLLQQKPTFSSILAVLKHPLCIFYKDPDYVNHWERSLRSSRKTQEPEGFATWFDQLQAILKPVESGDVISRHLTLMSRLSSDPIEEISEFTEAARALMPLEVHDYVSLLTEFLKTPITIQSGSSDSLVILDPREAHLCKGDTVVLAGLNEGIWPMHIPPNQWLGSQQRQQLGLPLLESQVGHAARDFCMALGAKHVFITRSLTIDGVLTIPSRWIERLLTILPHTESQPWREWAQRLDAVDQVQPMSRPRPCPPPHGRFQKISVSGVQRLMQDPYVYYAQTLLGLIPLMPLDEPPGAREWGTMVHQVIDAFTKAGLHPDEAHDWLYRKGIETINALELPHGTRYFWGERWRLLSRWLIDKWAERPVVASQSEVAGSLALGSWQLTAIADRLEQVSGTCLRLLDFKTGLVPSLTDVRRGLFPQLPLEGLIALKGGYKGHPVCGEVILEYWNLRGHGEPLAEVIELRDPSALVEEAAQGVQELLSHFREAPYVAALESAFSDFAPLIRRQEWLVAT